MVPRKEEIRLRLQPMFATQLPDGRQNEKCHYVCHCKVGQNLWYDLNSTDIEAPDQSNCFHLSQQCRLPVISTIVVIATISIITGMLRTDGLTLN